MAGPPSDSAKQFARLAALPPYVLAAVDELKSKLRAEGHDVFDFGLGNPDGPSPKAAIERLVTEAQRAGQPALHAVEGHARGAARDLRLVRAHATARRSIPRRRRSSRSAPRRASRTSSSRSSAPGDCVLSPDPCYPIHRYGIIIAGGEPVPVATRPGQDAYAEIEAALARAPRKPKGLVVNFPHNPTSAVVELGVLREGRRAREARVALGDLRSRLRRSACTTDARRPASSRCRARATWPSSSSPCRRATRCRAGASASASATARSSARSRRSRATSTTACSRPTQLAAATALSLVRRRRRRQPRALQAPLDAARRRPREGRLAGAAARPPRCSSGRPLPARRTPHLGAVGFASALLEQARVAVSPGVGFGPGGEGYVRFALIEPDERAQRACAAIGAYLRTT